MRKSRLFLGMAWLSALLTCVSVIISRVAIWTARLLSFPSLVGSLVFLALYAKCTRAEYLEAMMTQPELSLLRDFFGAYFHEDWNWDAENPESIVRSFVSEATPEMRAVLANAIVKYAAGFASDKELEEQLFRELGCYYLPSGTGTSCKVWLEHIAEELR